MPTRPSTTGQTPALMVRLLQSARGRRGDNRTVLLGVHVAPDEDWHGGLDDRRPLGPTQLRLLICGVKLPPATRRAVGSTFAKTPSLAREQKHATRRRFAAMGLTRPKVDRTASLPIEGGLVPAVEEASRRVGGAEMNRAPVVGEMPELLRSTPRSGLRSQLRMAPRVFALNRPARATRPIEDKPWHAHAVVAWRDRTSAQRAAMTPG